MKSPVLGTDLKKLYPISMEGQSDTATFDNAPQNCWSWLNIRWRMLP